MMVLDQPGDGESLQGVGRGCSRRRSRRRAIIVRHGPLALGLVDVCLLLGLASVMRSAEVR